MPQPRTAPTGTTPAFITFSFVYDFLCVSCFIRICFVIVATSLVAFLDLLLFFSGNDFPLGFFNVFVVCQNVSLLVSRDPVSSVSHILSLISFVSPL